MRRACDSLVYTDMAFRPMVEANQRGWTVVSMKDDWKRIFNFE